MKKFKRHTKIIATLGPVSDDPEMIKKMSDRGMDVVRINCSHGTEKQHQHMIDTVRENKEKHKLRIRILMDLAGYRIRLRQLKKKLDLDANEIVYMSNQEEDDDDVIPFDYDGELADIGRNAHVFIDDGKIHLKVMAVAGKKMKLKVIQGGVLKSRKGVNIPTLKMQSNIMTEEDRADIQFSIKNQVDFIAQSFVRNKKDIQRVVEVVRPVLPKCKIIAKIENEEGVRNIDGIIDACDGLMVARGDLGVTLPLYKIPIVQKYLIRECNRKKKLAITATQMLDSMIWEGRPTRAEVSDVANAILDGSDFVMLSGETSVGKYPSRSIQTMRQIIEYTERSQDIRL